MTEHEKEIASDEEPRELLLMRAGGLAFALYADEVETVAPWTRPVPLPQAPAAVLGVVSVRGRMLTVLGPTRLLDAGQAATADARPQGTRVPSEPSDSEHHFIASLRGDEQLALAFERAERFFAVPPELAPPETGDLPVLGTFPHGAETIHLLDPTRLFDAALRGTDRRRQRRVRDE